MNGNYFLLIDKTILMNLSSKEKDNSKKAFSKVILDIIRHQKQYISTEKSQRIQALITQNSLDEILKQIKEEEREYFSLYVSSFFKVIDSENVDKYINMYENTNGFEKNDFSLIAIGTHIQEDEEMKVKGIPIIITDNKSFIEKYGKEMYTHMCLDSTSFIMKFVPYQVCFHPDCGAR